MVSSWDVDDGGEITADSPLSRLVSLEPYMVTEDQHGHNVPLATRAPKNLQYRIDMILSSSGSPYATKSELVRDCIYLGIVIINLRQQISDNWKLDMKLAEQTSRMERHKRIYDRCTEICAALEILCSNGDEDQAKVDLQGFLDLITENPEYPKYASCLKKKLADLHLKQLVKLVD